MMVRITASAEKVVGARRRDVYAFLRDYEQRPQILPPSYRNYEILEGGIGEGTVVTYLVHAGGEGRRCQMRAKEPAPGHVLEEHDDVSTLVNRWTLRATDDGHSTRVRLESEWDRSRGVRGLAELTFATRAMRRLHIETLRRLGPAVRRAVDRP